MNNETAAINTLKYFNGAYHCAEAVACGVAEALGLEDPHGLARNVAAFGGGIGKTEEELCGALSGALMILGHLEGRHGPSSCWQDMADRATELRSRFVELHGCTRCGELLDRMGQQTDMDKCRELAARTATILTDMLRTRTEPCKSKENVSCC